MKAVKRTVASRIRDALRRDAFRIEPLEPRVLLSADPIFAPMMAVLAPDRTDIQSITEAYAAAQASSSPSISVPLMARLLSSPAANSSAQTFAVDAVLFDLGQMSLQAGFLDTSLRVAANEVLGGSGSFNVDLFNTGLVSPGYSPGVQDVASFTQDASGTLLIELGGSTAGTGDGHYDQINISGAAVLGGTLNVALYGGYKPQDGETFTVMNYGSVTGKFDVGSGLLKTGDGLFFEVTQGATSLVLTAHTIDPSLGYVLDVLDGEPSDQIGQWLNFNYFQDIAPVAFAGSLNLGGNLTAQGQFTLAYNADESFTPIGGSALNTNVWSLSASNVDAFLGVSGQGLALGGLDLNLAFVQVDTAGYGWVLGQGLIDTATVSGLTGVSLQGTNLALDINWGYGNLPSGGANSSLLDLSLSPITVGSATFNSNGATGPYLLASGTLAGSVADVTLNATVGVSVLGDSFVMAGKNVTASLAAGGVAVGVSNGAFGFLADSSGMAFEATGALALTGGGFASVSADAVRVVINRTGTLQTGRVLSFAGDYSYTFADVVASSGLQAVGVVGLQASLGAGLNVSGNFSFEKDGSTNTMRVVAQGASAQVAAGSFKVGVQHANLGLTISAAGRVLEASGAISANLGEEMTLSASQVTLRLNETTDDASGAVISAAGQSYTFSSAMQAGMHELSIVGGELSLAGFVQASGSLAVRWAGQPASLSLADGTTRSVNQIWVAGTGLAAAVGLNAGKPEFVGFSATGLEFVLGLFSDTANTANQWTSLSGTMGGSKLSGLTGVTLAANALALTYNSASSGQRVADFTGSNAKGITLAGKTLNLSADGSKGELLQASGQLNLDLLGFVQVSGDFALESKTQAVTLADGSDVTTQMLTIGAKGVAAFVGLNGGQTEEMGLRVSDAEFGFVVASDQADPARRWVSLQAVATAASMQGVSGLKMTASDLLVSVNRAATDGSVIDYQAAPLGVVTDSGGTELLLDMDGSKGALTQVQVGRATLAVSDYIYVSGGFYMEMADTIAVDVATGLPATYPAGMNAALQTGLGKVDGLSADHSRIEDLQVKPLTLSFTDVDVFAGIGPYFVDANGNGLMDVGEVVNPDRMGITLDNIDLALVLMDSTLLADPDSVIPKFYALQLDWKTPLDVDWDYFKFQIDDLQVQANQGGQWKGAPTLSTPYIDFASSFGATGYEIPTSGDSVFLNYDKSFVGVSIGHALLNVGNFFQVEGSFALEKVGGQKVDVVTGLPSNLTGSPAASLASELTALKQKGYLSANNALLSDLPVDMLTIGASDVTITIGNPGDPLLVLDNIDVAFSTMKATADADPSRIIPRLYGAKAFWATPLDVDWGFMQLKVDDLQVQMNKGANWQGTQLSPYLDYQSSFGPSGLNVATGGAPISLDFNRSMFGVSVGHALVKIDDFFHLEGGFAIEKSSSVQVDIATGFNSRLEGGTALNSLVGKGLSVDGTRIDDLTMNAVTLGFSNVKLFAGSGPYFVDSNDDGVSDSTSSDAVGLVVENLDLGLVIYTAADASVTLPKLWALKATADQAAFVGVDFLTLSAEGVTVVANQGALWSGSTVKPYVDFASTYGADGLSISTGGDPMALAYQSGYFGVQVAKATLRIDEFVYVQGAFSFEKGQRQRVTVDTGITVTDIGMAATIASLSTSAGQGAVVSADWSTVSNLEVEAMTFGMNNVNVFVGYGVPDFDSVKPVKDQAGVFGVAIKDVDLALAILTPTAKSLNLPKFTALKATASEFVVAGGEGIFELSGNDIAVNLNWGSAWQAAPAKRATVDFVESFGAGGLLVPTGATPMALNFTETLIEAKVSSALLAISEFVHVSGDFSFRKSGTTETTVKQGLNSIAGVKVNAIDIGANNVHAFVGLNGPTSDVNLDGVINTDDLTDQAIGLKVNDFDFGLSILVAQADITKPTIAQGTKFTALKAHANDIALVGFGDFIEFDLNDVSVAINQGSVAVMVADFTQGGSVAGRTVQTGGVPILLDFNSELIEASVGLATANVAGIVSLQGGFAFQKRTLDRIGFNLAGMEVIAPADALVVAGMDVQAFAGFNGPYKTLSKDPATGALIASEPNTDAVGFAIDNLDFVLAMLTPSKASGFAVPGVNFYSLYASADKAGLVGTDPYLTLEGTDVVLKLNGAVAGDYPIPSLYVDYTELPGGKLTVPVGTAGNNISLDYNSNLLGLQINAKLGIFDLFDISYDFSFDFEMPSINLGNLGLPSVTLPNFDLLDFKLPSLQLMEFELPSLLDLRFEIPNFTLPTLPGVDWVALLELPGFDVNLPTFTLPACMLTSQVAPYSLVMKSLWLAPEP
ncbi:MAG: LEPR-XLL domain-containing protein, partial [Actinobacteria bacterium]|nr:LEPR-XLL domain-containing protein [Actinomycetota bacterium]